MTRFTLSAAARVCGCDRRTLQRAVQAGRLHLDAQHCLSREVLVAAGYLDASAPQDTPQYEPHVTPHLTPHVAPQETPQELPLVTALLAHLEQLTRTIVALHQEVILLREDLRQPPQRRRSLKPQETLQVMPHDAAPVPQHDALTPQDTPQVMPHVAPHDVTPPPHVAPHGSATPESLPAPTSPPLRRSRPRMTSSV